jgi:hexosaminidase
VTIDAGAEVGVQYALETLSQLVYYDFDRSQYITQAVLPLKIEDEPSYPHRGLLIDSSRHFLPIASIRNLIRSMSFAKLNRLHWHLTDAQSFPLGSRVEPSLAAKGAWSRQERYSRDDVADVVNFAAEHGITVVPEFDMPGHMKAWGFGRPDIVAQTYDRFNDGNSAAFNPTKEQSYQLVESTLRDWLVGNGKDPAFFSGSLVHLGTDEMPFSAWQSISETPPKSIFKDFVKRMVTYSEKLGKQPILWEEGFKDGGNVPQQAIIQVWLDKKIASQAIAAGHKVLISEGWYLDHLDTSWQAMYQRDPAASLLQDQRSSLLGGEGCMWGETVDGGDLEQTVWPRLGAVAERLWSNVDGAGDVEEAQPRLVAFRCLLLERGVAAGTLGGKGRSSPTGPGSCNQ